MIPLMGAGASPNINGGHASSGIDGDTSQDTSSKGAGLYYNKGNGIPSWVIALGIVAYVGILVYSKKDSK
ncbi:hypothetical protein [Pseudoteredinibacter isoporae]|uniref:hypothetical protein n=1 Tax=Pseudoteredinibacter isoporae TaxID=570281 RepID=UPI00310AD789